MDASFKQYSYTQGMDLKTAVPLDANALLNAAQSGATVNAQEGWVQNLNQAVIQSQLTDYQNRLTDCINSTSTGANSTVGDVIGKKMQMPRGYADWSAINYFVGDWSAVSRQVLPAAQVAMLALVAIVSTVDQDGFGRGCAAGDFLPLLQAVGPVAGVGAAGFDFDGLQAAGGLKDEVDFVPGAVTPEVEVGRLASVVALFDELRHHPGFKQCPACCMGGNGGFIADAQQPGHQADIQKIELG